MPAMAPRKGPLSRSPLGQPSVNSNTYQESVDLLGNSHDVEPGESAVVSRHSSSSSRRDFRIKTSGSRFGSVEPMGVPTSEAEFNDADSHHPGYAHSMVGSHDSIDLTHVGYDDGQFSPIHSVSSKQSLRMQRLRSIDDTGHSYSYPSQSDGCPRQCCCLVAVFVCAFVAVILIFVALYHQPKSPTLEMRDLNITSFNFDAGENGEPPMVAASLRVLLRLTNPNRKSVLHYDGVYINLNYHRSVLSSVSIPHFKQYRKSTKTFAVTLREKPTLIEDPIDEQNILGEASRLNIQMDLRGAVLGRYKDWAIKWKKFVVPVNCKLNVKPADDGRPAYLMSNSCYYFPS